MFNFVCQLIIKECNLTDKDAVMEMWRSMWTEVRGRMLSQSK
jgi:hypothetical protein